MPLFAEGTSDAGLAALMAISAVLGGGIQWLLKWIATRRDERQAKAQAARDQERKERIEDEVAEIARLERYIGRLERDFNAQKHEMDLLRDVALKAQVKSARAVTWIRGLEPVLVQHKITYPRWSEVSDSDQELEPIHRPEPQT